ncbi:MAG: hypothetical protein AB7G06_04490 [Bdellovibrionales bacterium]
MMIAAIAVAAIAGCGQRTEVVKAEAPEFPADMPVAVLVGPDTVTLTARGEAELQRCLAGVPGGDVADIIGEQGAEDICYDVIFESAEPLTPDNQRYIDYPSAPEVR